MKLGFIGRFSKTPPNVEFHENLSSGSRVVSCPQPVSSWAVILGVSEVLTTLNYELLLVNIFPPLEIPLHISLLSGC